MIRFVKLAWKAIGSLASFAPSSPFHLPTTPIEEMWRQDWAKLGLDARIAIEHAHEKTGLSRKAARERKLKQYA